MEVAINEAKIAYQKNEVPVGCVIYCGDKLITKGHNTTIADKNDTHHAEINAINDAISILGDKNLSECEMYVTLEPCPMCAGAIINTKIKRLYIGAFEPKSGCFGSVMNFCQLPFNHKPEVYVGIHEEECKKIIKDFFEGKRKTPVKITDVWRAAENSNP